MGRGIGIWMMNRYNLSKGVEIVLAKDTNRVE